jgi:group I intron endonuclease
MESDNNIFYVYCISNNLDGKMYIGYTKRFERRMREHCKSKYYIGNAIRKHGKENFTFQKLLWFDTEAEAKDTEKCMISELNTLCPLGYNEAEGGRGNPMAGASEDKKKERSENIRKGLANMNSNAKALRRQRVSEARGEARGKLYNLIYINLSYEQKYFIVQKRFNELIPIHKIPKYFFETFNTKIVIEVIDRVLKEFF